MLPKKNRIPRKDFPTASRQGSRVFSPLFSGVIHESQNEVRVSVVVSKKTAKTAVVRNALRRQVYTAVSPLLKDILRGALIVLYPKIQAKQAHPSVLRKEIETVFRNAKLVK